MRLFLLPLSTRRALIYCQRPHEPPAAELNLVQRAINRVPQTWAKWETAGSGWKKTLTKYGNRGLQRIPYEEWGLKSFPPLNEEIQAKELSEGKKFQLIYPSSIIQREDVRKIIQRLASERKQLHWRRFIWSLIGLPFTVPLGLIPIFPNLPFFYLAFRCYSHWRALKGSDHLDFLIDHRLLILTPNQQVESVYEKIAPKKSNKFTFVTRTQVLEGIDPEELMLLQAGSDKLIADRLQVPELAAEVERAVRQVEENLERERRQESRSIDAVHEEKERGRK